MADRRSYESSGITKFVACATERPRDRWNFMDAMNELIEDIMIGILFNLIMLDKYKLT